MKYFIFSLDDGTIYDKKVIDLFNKYHICGTFNLNSGLNDYIWYLDNVPIKRLNLIKDYSIYNGHEVASHTLTHPYLDQLKDEDIIKEVNMDIINLNSIFNIYVESFATPFDTCKEREISIIKSHSLLSNIRMSEIDESFRLPNDPYHFKITALDIDKALELFPKFKKDKNAEIFIYAGHSYDFFVPTYRLDKLEKLIQDIISSNDIEVVTMKQLVKLKY